MKFGPFEFDAARSLLWRNGEPVTVSQRGLQLLRVLTERRGDVVSKDDMMDAAWPGQAVEESNLTVQIASLRKVLGVDENGADWIATVPRVGYRFLGTASSPRVEASKPVVAVLPFENVSDDPQQQFFAQGLAEDLITDLSRVPGLMVIARNSSFAMRERRGDVRGIGGDLGAGFVVDGSVRRAAERVRINVQLIEASDQSQLWAERFDGDLNDVFSLQDQVVRRIVGALQRVLAIGPAPRDDRRAVSIDAYDFFQRGRALVLNSVDGYRIGHPMLVRATEVDPDFAEAFAWLAMSHVHAWLNWGEPREENHARSVTAAERAFALDPRNADALTFLGYVKMIDGELDAGLAMLDRAIEADPSHTDAHLLKAETFVHLGRPDEAVEVALEGFKLNPYPPMWYFWILGFSQYAAGRYADAITTLDRPITRNTVSRRILAASYAQLGQLDRAKEATAEFLAVVPHFSIADWSAGQPLRRKGDRERYIEGFRKAGLPD